MWLSLKEKSNNSPTKPQIPRTKFFSCLITIFLFLWELRTTEEILIVGILGFVEIVFIYSFIRMKSYGSSFASSLKIAYQAITSICCSHMLYYYALTFGTFSFQDSYISAFFGHYLLWLAVFATFYTTDQKISSHICVTIGGLWSF